MAGEFSPFSAVRYPCFCARCLSLSWLWVVPHLPSIISAGVTFPPHLFPCQLRSQALYIVKFLFFPDKSILLGPLVILMPILLRTEGHSSFLLPSRSVYCKQISSFSACFCIQWHLYCHWVSLCRDVVVLKLCHNVLLCYNSKKFPGLLTSLFAALGLSIHYPAAWFFKAAVPEQS